MRHHRVGVSVLPQHPLILSGTLRWNLDPHSLVSDQELYCALSTVGLSPALSSPVDSLSWCDKRRLAAARLLLDRPALALLDEVAVKVSSSTTSLSGSRNHQLYQSSSKFSAGSQNSSLTDDHASASDGHCLERVLDVLRGWGSAVVLVTHDRDAVKLCDKEYSITKGELKPAALSK